MSTLESIFSQNSFHAVVHLAADMDFYPSDVRTVQVRRNRLKIYKQNNFETMKNLLEAAYRGGVREFVFVSSTMVHLPQAGLTTETSPLGYVPNALVTNLGQNTNTGELRLSVKGT